MATPTKPEVRRHEFDDVYGHVRSLGRYQVMLYVAANLMVYTMNGQFNALLFPMATPPFHCATPNVTCPISSCCGNCTSYVFDGSFTSTATKWNLICDRAYLAATVRSCFFVGSLVGSLCVGIMSDAWGRKKSMMLYYTLMLIVGSASSFANNLTLYAFLQFVIGFTTGTLLPNFVYFMEVVGPRRRTFAGIVSLVTWEVTWIVHTLLAYAIKDWRYLVLSYTLPGAVLLPMWILVPESPRWLVAHGRVEEANTVLNKFGPKKGKQQIDKQSLRSLTEDVRKAQLEDENQPKRVYTPIDLVRAPKLRKWTAILMFNWFTVGIVVFGVYLFLSQLSGNIYLNYIIFAGISVIRVPIQWFLFHRAGRRASHAGFMLLSGVCCLMVLAFYKDYPLATSGLSIVGGAMAGGGFGGVYMITTEIVPTTLRNTAIGLGSTVSRLGAVISPYIAMTAQLPGLSIVFPVTIFGSLGVVSALLMYWVPETLRAKMHQTMEETEAAHDDYRLPCCWTPVEDSQAQLQLETRDVEERECEVNNAL